MIDRILNKIWFWLHYRRYKRFCEKIKSKERYDKKDIWYHRKLGFICMPVCKTEDFEEKLEEV